MATDLFRHLNRMSPMEVGAGRFQFNFQDVSILNRILFRFTNKRMCRTLFEHVGDELTNRERQRLLDSSRIAKSKRNWFDILVQFGQEIEMSASLARMQNQQEEYNKRLRLAGNIYAFVRSHTTDASLRERMDRAEHEIIRRISTSIVQ